MSDHLPECPANGGWDMGCFCTLLRACEARVREEWSALSRDNFDAGYAAALAGAREAVAALIAYEVTKDGHLILRGEAEAAINALREKP